MIGDRPPRLALVTGTRTGVGKTWWTAAVARSLFDTDIVVSARKPVCSFAPHDVENDADVLAAATGEMSTVVCPPHRRYAEATAPPMAAAALGAAPFTVRDLATEVAQSWPDDVQVGLVEGVGGPRSPIAGDGDTVDLALALDPDLVVLVADAGLGTINDVRLCVAALSWWRPVVVLNHYDADDNLHSRNRRWLTERAGLDVCVDVSVVADLVADGWG